MYSVIIAYGSVKVNDSNVVTDEREELEILCYKLPTPAAKQYGVIWKWTSIVNAYCEMQTPEQSLRKFLNIDIPRQKRQSNHTKCSINIGEGREKVDNQKKKKRKKETKNKGKE